MTKFVMFAGNCETQCINGYCGYPDKCHCHAGWQGDTCSEGNFCFVSITALRSILDGS